MMVFPGIALHAGIQYPDVVEYELHHFWEVEGDQSGTWESCGMAESQETWGDSWRHGGLDPGSEDSWILDARN